MHVETSWAGSSNITDLHKFQTVARVFLTDNAARITAVVVAPPAERKYEAVKAAWENQVRRP